MTTRVIKQLITADKQTITCPYWVDDDAGADMPVATAQLAAMAQFQTDFGLPPSDWPVQQLSDKVCIVRIVYAPAELAQSDPPHAVPLGGYASPAVDYEFFFEPKPQKHLKVALAHVSHTTGAPPYQGKMNVVNEGGVLKVEGTTVSVPAATHRIKYVAPNAAITGAYKAVVEDLCGSVNNATFRGRAIGEVMLVKASGTKRTGTDWELVFEFATGVTETNVTRDEVLFASIRPFDHWWVASETIDVIVTGNPITFLKGKHGYVEQVWPYKNLSALNLPA